MTKNIVLMFQFIFPASKIVLKFEMDIIRNCKKEYTKFNAMYYFYFIFILIFYKDFQNCSFYS